MGGGGYVTFKIKYTVQAPENGTSHIISICPAWLSYNPHLIHLFLGTPLIYAAMRQSNPHPDAHLTRT